MASGESIRVTLQVKSTSGNPHNFQVAYSTAEVGNSGWRSLVAGPDFSEVSFEYGVAPKREGRGDYLGILPDPSGNGAGIYVRRVDFSVIQGVAAEPVAVARVETGAATQPRQQALVGPQCLPAGTRVLPGQPKPFCGELGSLASINVREGRLTTITDGLKYPWAFEFLNDDEILISEFAGRLLILDLPSGESLEVTGLPAVSHGRGQLGLLDVALHPDFAANRLIYFSYVTERENKYALRVSQATLEDGALVDVSEIITSRPYGKLSSNFGGALAFDASGYLYIGVGDHAVRDWAQNPLYLAGKILRLTEDGDVPEDNPFLGRESHHPAIYALGVRNPQGLVFDELDGTLYETEHGPMGGDEVNIIEGGLNYGWPTITYGMNYTYVPIGVGHAADGMQQPFYYYLPSLAVSPIAIYRGAQFEEWQGHLLVGALRGRAVSKIDVAAGGARSERMILSELDGRIRDIKIASDGSIWFLVQEGRLVRLSRESKPLATSETPGNRSGRQIYEMVCGGCHSTDMPGVPQLHAAADWEASRGKSRAELYEIVLLGSGAMPPRGLCETCSDEELEAAVDFMLQSVK